MFESLPAPTSTTILSGKYGPYQQTKREATTRFEIGEGREGTIAVEVVTSHDPDSKVFRASCTWVEIKSVERHPMDGPGVASIITWSSANRMVSLLREPVARYSKKALEETHQHVMSTIEQFPEMVEPVFVQAQAALSVEVEA